VINPLSGGKLFDQGVTCLIPIAGSLEPQFYATSKYARALQREKENLRSQSQQKLICTKLR
jgi:hypothetical protein